MTEYWRILLLPFTGISGAKRLEMWLAYDANKQNNRKRSLRLPNIEEMTAATVGTTDVSRSR